MAARDLLWEVKNSKPDLWRRLCVKGVNNCSEKKLMANEDEVKRFFDVSADWRMISARGNLTGANEYAKPLWLTTEDHGPLVRAARRGIAQAIRSVPWRPRDNRSGAKELFCAFST